MLRKIKKRGSWFVVRGSLAVLSAVLLVLSFPNFNIWPLAWFAFVPLFFAIEGQKPLNAFLLAYLAGVVFFLGTVYWLIHVTLPGMIAVALYLALYFGFFGLFFSYPLPITHYPLLYLPALWVTLEWIRSHLLSGFGWALLAHSQSFNLPVIQISDVAGAYGISFLIFAVNVSLYLTIKNFRKKDGSITPLFITIIAVFLVLYYGYFRLNNIFTGEKLKVAVIQGNVPQAEKWDVKFREEIIARYENLTRLAAAEKPDLIIWPETSVPGFLESEKDLFYRVSSLAISLNTPLLVGTPSENFKEKDVYYNSAVLVGDDGGILGRYDKIHLVPFGEYIPFKQAFSFVRRFSTMPIGDFASGKDWSVFKFIIKRTVKKDEAGWTLIKKVKFSCLICFEDIFPDISREFVARGANFLVNITNDAWFGKTNAAYQHAQCSIFRAVENRTSVIRAANTGVSCFIDQKGRILDPIEKDGDSLFVEGFGSHEIVLTRTKTFYNRYGDIFAYLCIAIAGLGIVMFLKNGLTKVSYKNKLK